MENAGLIRNKSPKHIQGRHLGLEPARPSRGRILPSSTADVQAAIAAIQARSAALRRQQQNAVSIVNPKENRTDGVSGRSQINKRDSIDDDSSIDSDDVNEDYFANIGNLIDGVNGIQNKENEEESIYSSDSDESSDMSLGEDGKVVSAATKLNIGAFIDSLNAAAKMPISDSQNEIDNVKMNEPKDYGDNIFAKKEKVPTMAGSEVPVQYDELKLDAYINKALDVASRSRDAGSNPNFERLESVIFYAWKNKVPIIPVIDAFDDAMKERQECSATRFTYFVRKAVRLVEEDTFDDKKSLALLKTMQAKRLDTSFLKAMFKNPEKHVVYHDIVAHIENLNFIDTTLEKEREKENKSSDFTDGSPRKFARVNHVYLSQKMQQLSNAHSHYLRDVEISCIPDIDSVSSSRKILTEKVFLQHPTITPFRVEHWKLSEEERKNRHSGYHGVHAKSLSNTASQAGIFHISESFKWEQVELELTKKRRLVDTANWVGEFEQTRENRRVKAAITQPDTIVYKRLVYPKQWDEEWYTTWLSRKHNLGGQTLDKQRYRPMYSDGSIRPTTSADSSRFGMADNQEEIQDTSIGKLHTMRYRAGERMSRVHYDYTSFLYESSWKRKYFPKGIFS